MGVYRKEKYLYSVGVKHFEYIKWVLFGRKLLLLLRRLDLRLFRNSFNLFKMQKYIELFKFILKENPNNKIFAVLFLIIIVESVTLFLNARNYREDVDYCNNRRDSDLLDFQKKINECRGENREVYNKLVDRYERLYNESQKLLNEDN